jgi:hypothetical protein
MVLQLPGGSGINASGDAEAKADAINLKITRGMTTTPIAERTS